MPISHCVITGFPQNTSLCEVIRGDVLIINTELESNLRRCNLFKLG
jgi:hypothetical protein